MSKKKLEKKYFHFFLKVTHIEKLVSYGLAHDREKTGVFFSDIQHFDIEGLLMDWSHMPDKEVRISVYCKKELVADENDLREEMRIRSRYDDTEEEQNDLREYLTPDSIGYLQKNGDKLCGGVFIPPHVWNNLFALSNAQEPLYAALDTFRYPRKRAFIAHDFTLTTKDEV